MELLQVLSRLEDPIQWLAGLFHCVLSFVSDRLVQSKPVHSACRRRQGDGSPVP